MADLANITDVEEILGTISDSGDIALTNALIRRASAMVRDAVVNIDLRLANSTLDSQTVADVVADMVIRVLRNPEGVKQETIGPTATTYDPTVASGRLFIDPEQLYMLTPSIAVRSPVGTIRTVPVLASRRIERFGEHRRGYGRRWL